MGTVAGNIYTVAPGDTLFSIGQRFGVTVSALASANGLPPSAFIFPGQRLAIPGLVPGPTPIPVTPTPVQPTATPIGPTPIPTISPTPFIAISQPTPNAVVPVNFLVSGTASGLPNNTVTVRALSATGQILAERSVALQPGSMPGAPSTWSAQLTVSVTSGSTGVIFVFSSGSPASASVSVRYGTAPPPIKIFQPGECTIQGRAGAPLSATAGGSPIGSFPGNFYYAADRSTIAASQFWYMFFLTPGTPAVWASGTSILSASQGCIWSP